MVLFYYLYLYPTQYIGDGIDSERGYFDRGGSNTREGKEGFLSLVFTHTAYFGFDLIFDTTNVAGEVISSNSIDLGWYDVYSRRGDESIKENGTVPVDLKQREGLIWSFGGKLIDRTHHLISINITIDKFCFDTSIYYVCYISCFFV